MRLSVNQKIVDDLKQILQNYDYLEYDEARSDRDEKFEGLSVRIISDAERDVQVIVDICHRLEKQRTKYFYTYGGSYRSGDNLEEVWSFFTLREKN